MPKIAEQQLATWTARAYDNEDEKAANTERIIREALNAHPTLRALPIDVYAKGSYRNNTNVRRDSDVDIAVEYTGMITPEYGPDTSQSEVRRVQKTSAYTGPFRDSDGVTRIDRFKDAVGSALTDAFGLGAVTRHNKVFTVRESSRSLAADVVPCNTYRKYWSPERYHEGLRLLPDRPPPWNIVNYPHQHYANGVRFNDQTWRRFKRTVRILKNLENHMVAARTSPVVASYLIECLVYNAPVNCFNGDTWGARARRPLPRLERHRAPGVREALDGGQRLQVPVPRAAEVDA